MFFKAFATLSFKEFRKTSFLRSLVLSKLPYRKSFLETFRTSRSYKKTCKSRLKVLVCQHQLIHEGPFKKESLNIVLVAWQLRSKS